MRVSVDSVRFSVLSLGLLVFFAFGSVYFFQSGVPQPADLFLAGSVFLGLTLGVTLPGTHSDPIFKAAMFLGWVMIVLLVWATILGDPGLLRIMTYYVYNVLIFSFILMVAGKDEERFWTLVKYAAIIGVGSCTTVCCEF